MIKSVYLQTRMSLYIFINKYDQKFISHFTDYEKCSNVNEHNWYANIMLLPYRKIWTASKQMQTIMCDKMMTWQFLFN